MRSPGKKKFKTLVLKRARQVLSIEAEALLSEIPRLGKDFLSSVELILQTLNCGGKVVVMGIGKSGLVGRKISATLSSTGTPSVFFHPAEALHGDLGAIEKKDAVIVLSASGETEEISRLLPALRLRGSKIIALTGNAKSNLAQKADATLPFSVKEEACPLNLAPTASTTVMLAMGDALAMALMEERGFKAQDFARLHPSGTLGRRLTFLVKDIMRKGKDCPQVQEQATIKEALLAMTRTRAGATAVINKNGTLCGYFTDGDLRRKFQTSDRLLVEDKVKSVMTRNPTTITPDSTLEEALKIFKTIGVDNLPVVDANKKLIGILDERDLLI